jgi:membrane associated rhomboid family serine protease
MVIGFVMVLVGALIPWFMILGTLRSTFFLGLVSYAASIGGLILGVIGATLFVRKERRKKRQ